jgi:sulfate adenylyltransferase subunit 1
MKPYEPFQHDQPPQDSDHQVVRFLTAGSVDDGKSTLIGRLLYDCKAVLADQVVAIERAKHKRTEAGVLDLSLLTDGLEAEREQGITIDVAYRYFSDGLTKFIVADAPGHEQYTRNMVTAASNSEAIVLLIDPTRVPLDGAQQAQLLPQTRRHAAIAALLGLQHLAVAVNKMDRVGHDAQLFERIETAALHLARQLGLPKPQVIPISALNGDNVVSSSEAMPWYSGPTLLTWLKTLGKAGATKALPGSTANARFFVQRVQRAYGEQAVAGTDVDGLRGLQGVLTQGTLAVGDSVTVLPAQARATVASLRGLDGELSSVSAEHNAAPGQPLTVHLRENVDVCRGDVLEVSDGSAGPRAAVHHIDADLCWLDATALSRAKRYWLQWGTARVQAKVTGVHDVLDLNLLQRVTLEEPTLAHNQIGRVSITLALPMPLQAASLSADPATARFILIDPGTHQTAAAGLVREP